MQGEGGTIGPDLSGYGRNNLDYWLVNIVDPSAELREGYVNHRVETKDGRTLTGVVVDRSGGGVTLQSLSGEQTVLAQEEIEELEALAISLMPERLLEGLPEQHVRDLLTYIIEN